MMLIVVSLFLILLSYASNTCLRTIIARPLSHWCHVDYSGKYFIPDCQVSPPCELAQDDNLARDLWELSIKVIKDATGEDLDLNLEV